MYKPTHKEICETMKLDLQCSRCGSRVKNACQDCIISFNHWSNCYEEAKSILIKRNSKHTIEKASNLSSKAIDDLLESLSK